MMKDLVKTIWLDWASDGPLGERPAAALERTALEVVQSIEEAGVEGEVGLTGVLDTSRSHPYPHWPQVRLMGTLEAMWRWLETYNSDTIEEGDVGDWLEA